MAGQRIGTIESMTLKELVDKLRDGYGFWRSELPRRAGQMLASIIGEDEEEEVVTVECVAYSWGYGPDYRRAYVWYVTGYTPKALLEKGRASEVGGKHLALFGGRTGYIRREEDGFSIHME